MENLGANGLHHITLIGANRQISMDFWEGVMGFPFVFEQPNLDNPEENHLYFEPGDGNLITIFTNENRSLHNNPAPTPPGAVHHIAFNVTREKFNGAIKRLTAHNIPSSDITDRGFMDSIYFREPLGLVIELATYKFEPPEGVPYSDVLRRAFEIRKAAGDYAITLKHLDQAIAEIS